VLPQTNLPPLLGLIDRHGLGLLALLLLLALPLVLVALSPWLEQAPHRGGYRREDSHRSHDAHRKAVKPSRWDPRTGVVGRQR